MATAQSPQFAPCVPNETDGLAVCRSDDEKYLCAHATDYGRPFCIGVTYGQKVPDPPAGWVKPAGFVDKPITCFLDPQPAGGPQTSCYSQYPDANGRHVKLSGPWAQPETSRGCGLRSGGSCPWTQKN